MRKRDGEADKSARRSRTPDARWPDAHKGHHYMLSPSSRRRRLIVRLRVFPFILFLLCLLLAACGGSPAAGKKHHTVSTSSGTISYDSGPDDLIIRTFYGGGRLGTLELSPEVSVYGDGSYILGPGLQMQQGRLSTASLDALLHTLVDSDGLLALSRRQFEDVPDQNATLLLLNLNGTSYSFLYGQFGSLPESAQDMNAYHHLDQALASITRALSGPTMPYGGSSAALLVHQDFSPDLTQHIPAWSLPDFTLAQAATYECGPVPQDITSPNAATACLLFTVPQNAILLTPHQQQAIAALLHGHPQGECVEQNLYYSVVLRPLLPDEVTTRTLAIFGSLEPTYTPIPLHSGPLPAITPTP